MATPFIFLAKKEIKLVWSDQCEEGYIKHKDKPTTACFQYFRRLVGTWCAIVLFAIRIGVPLIRYGRVNAYASRQLKKPGSKHPIHVMNCRSSVCLRNWRWRRLRAPLATGPVALEPPLSPLPFSTGPPPASDLCWPETAKERRELIKNHRNFKATIFVDPGMDLEPLELF
ncbi:hypothetical protein L3X38_015288 [Prunus dulcis]|uniref:Uncharacterized protein n=1 Tax=Prunus dulcis TaxID=3755 RepID=A0AAD4ZIU8_PRUDU|nr:hypothetical protein L3X38_015288 [Prunus dulcis]